MLSYVILSLRRHDLIRVKGELSYDEYRLDNNHHIKI
jgi:hypothetical protein